MAKVTAILLVCLAALLAHTVVSADQSGRLWRCSSHGLERTIVLHEQDATGQDGEFACWVIYTKEGVTETLWRAKNNPDYCAPKVSALIERLQSAGFTCITEMPKNLVDPPRDTAPPVVENSDTADTADTASISDIPEFPDVPEIPDIAEPADDLMPEAPLEASPVPTPVDVPATELRVLLEKHYEGNYLDAMLAAMPGGFAVQSDMDAISPGPLEYLHVGPPKHFIKTMSDGSYVLVNTTLFERGTTSSYVNFGFRVVDKRYRFLGYATTQPVANFKVLDANVDQIVLSVTPIATASCTPARRTQIIEWQDAVAREIRQDADPSIGANATGDCAEEVP
ncbi:MAG: hypothetical protein ACR2RD_00850 [Woeseiaceae bacterium]